jgi:hypothetical protein
MQEDAAGTWEVLGDDRVQQPGGDAALHDQTAEARAAGAIGVVVQRVAVARELGEELDVPLGHPAGAASDVTGGRHGAQATKRP